MKGRTAVVGGGVHGLAAAALLAARGRSVILFEAREQTGGLAASEEFHPGYRSAGTLMDTAWVSRRVAGELELSAFGLRFRDRGTAVFGPEREGSGILLEPGQADARELGEDARPYYHLRRYLERVQGVVLGLLESEVPSLQPAGIREHLEWLRRAWAARRLGRRDLYELFRVAPMPVADWMRDRLCSPRLQALLAVPALTPNRVGPMAPGTAANLILHLCTRRPEVRGGAPALAAALEKACRAGGVEIRTGARVARLAVRDGRVAAVVLEDGSDQEVREVYLASDWKRGLLELLEPGALSVEEEERVAAFRTRGSLAVLDLALEAPVDWASRPGERFEALRTGEDLVTLEQAADALKYGQPSGRPFLEIRIPTLAGAGQAPPGGQVLTALIHFVPENAGEGVREAVQGRALETLEELAPGLQARIAGLRLRLPADLEAEYGLSGGHLFHGEHALDQLGPLRPGALFAGHRTPVEGLVPCSPATHPLGGLSLLPPWHAVRSRAVVEAGA